MVKVLKNKVTKAETKSTNSKHVNTSNYKEQWEKAVKSVQQSKGVQKVLSENHSSFYTKVWQVVYLVPKGKVTTYKQIALVIGSGPRAVGQGMMRNCFAPFVPCHRVISNSGDIGGFGRTSDKSSEFVQQKLNMLKDEGIRFTNNKADPEQILDAEVLQKLLEKAKNKVVLQKDGNKIELQQE